MSANIKANARVGEEELGCFPHEPPVADAVDLSHLRRFTFGDRDLELEILELFMVQSPRTIEALKAAPTDQDWGVAAHTLKGSALAVGAWRIARLAEQAERLGGVSNRWECDLIVRRLEAAHGEARTYITSLESGS